MDMGHLYHDAVFGDPILALDVKEQLRTREINACEEMNLLRKSQIYDRAIDLCEKSANYEKWRIAQTLNMILERSPHLDRSLAVEKARLEMLHNVLLRRAAKANKEKSKLSSPYTTITTSTRPTTLTTSTRPTTSAKRPATRKGRSALKSIGRRRRQDREKSRRKKRAEGPILNTDFSLERHLQKKSLYSKRNEHAVKTLARINWQMETRRRDHRRFQENLVHFSKPMIEKARMVLRGRPDMDVEQFLQEFEEYLFPKDKSDTKGTHRKAARKRSKEKEKSLAREHSEVTLVQLSALEDSDGLLPSLADASNTGSNNIGHQETSVQDSSQDNTRASSVFQSSGSNQVGGPAPLPHADPASISKELSSKLRSLTLSTDEKNDEISKRLQGNDKETKSAPVSSLSSKSRPSSEREGSFHRPAIVATKSDVMNLKSRPGSSTGVLAVEQASEQKNSEIAKVRGDLHIDAYDSVLRNKTVDVNNNECNISSKNAKPFVAKPSNPNDKSGISNGKKNRTEKSKGDFAIDQRNRDKWNPTNIKSLGVGNSIEMNNKVRRKENEHNYDKTDLKSLENLKNSELTRNSNDKAGTKEYNINVRKSASKSAGLSSTPSTILSQIIMEEDDGDSLRNTPSTSSASPQPNHRQRKANKREHYDRVDGNVQKLPELKPHGRTYNNTNILPNLIHSTKDINNQNGEHRDWRKRTELADLFQTKEKRRGIAMNHEQAKAAEKSNKYQEKNFKADETHKKDLFQAIIDSHKPHSSRNTASVSESKDLRQFHSRHTKTSRDYPSDSPESFSLPSVVSKSESVLDTAASSRHGDDAPETAKQSSGGDMYTLTCTVGLPKLWKQSMEKKNDSRAAPEVSAASIARKHRRSRTNSQRLF